MTAFPTAPIYAPKPPDIPFWSAKIGEPYALFNATSQKPFHRLWRDDYVPDPPWYPTLDNLNSSGVLTPLTSGTRPKNKQLWRYDYVPQPDWQIPIWNMNADSLYLFRASTYVPTARAPFYTQRGAEFPPWQFPNFWENADALYIPKPQFNVNQQHNFWKSQYLYEPPPWLGTPEAARMLQQLGYRTTSPTKQWRYDYDSDVRLWNARPIGTTQNQFTAQTNPFFKQWRWDNVPQPDWLGEPQAISQSLRNVKFTPFFKLWRYDYDSDARVWNAAPTGTTQNQFKTQTNPFFKQWRWDHVPEPVWIGKPIPGYTLVQPSIATPFFNPRQFNYVPQPDWLGKPTPGYTLISPKSPQNPFFNPRQFNFVPASEWVGHSVGSAVIFLPPQAANQLLRNVIIRTRQLINEIERERVLRNAINPSGTYH